jgi:hypothetical protein
MKMGTHTKGPWKCPQYRIFASQMADAEYPIHAPKRGRIAKAHRADDARLISAAPDLLEACNRLIGSLGVMVADADSCEDIIFARAAIAKATGE